jgi:hypothetical protein
MALRITAQPEDSRPDQFGRSFAGAVVAIAAWSAASVRLDRALQRESHVAKIKNRDDQTDDDRRDGRAIRESADRVDQRHPLPGVVDVRACPGRGERSS